MPTPPTPPIDNQETCEHSLDGSAAMKSRLAARNRKNWSRQISQPHATRSRRTLVRAIGMPQRACLRLRPGPSHHIPPRPQPVD